MKENQIWPDVRAINTGRAFMNNVGRKIVPWSAASALGILLLAAAEPAFAAGLALSVGPNLNITKSTVNNAEITIAVNPLNPKNLFAIDTWAVVGRYSTNGGLTWLNSNMSALPASIGDVSASWDQFGNLFLVEMGTSLEILVGLSIDGGARFTFLAQSNATGNDQPTCVTGPSGTPGQGTLWINWTDQNNEVVVNGAVVTGLGVVGNFNSGQIVPGPGGDFGDIAVGPNGEVMVVYQDNGSGEGP